MYKFVIKGINGGIKYTSTTEFSSVNIAQNVGNRFKLAFIEYNLHNIIKFDTVEVINVSEMGESECVNECVNSELSTNNPNHLLVQQY